MWRAFVAIVALTSASASMAAENAAFDAAQLEFFEKKIRPLLVDNCFTCHSANTNSKGGLRVDDRNGLLTGGEHGAAIAPGKPDESLLIAAVAHTHEDLKMPPGKQLAPEQIDDLTKWIAAGAAWPQASLPDDVGLADAEYERLRKEHWAWQPLKAAAPPQVDDTGGWIEGDVDAFLLAALREQNLAPVGDADKTVLVRRVSYDLIGLPPTPEEIDAFLADDSSDALAKLVDRLLASPAFGERWGRHWLDVARYGESTGSSRNLPYPHAWRYRDYVIAAFNASKPFDRFLREQIAGDLLPADSQQQQDEQRIATGFLALGVKDVNQRFKVRFVMDNIDEQIDAVSRAFLGLTASCARCHDHKFDPIPTTDYYALAGIFTSSDLCAGVRNKMGGGGLDYFDAQMLLRIGPDAAAQEPDAEKLKEIAELREKIQVAKAEFNAFKGKPEGNEPGPDGRPKRQIARQKWNRLQQELNALTDPSANGGQVAFGVREGQQIGDTQIRVRGEAEQLGPSVPRGFLSVLHLADQPAIGASQSGRLELADWLTSEQNPLTPRVYVNRVWKHLFGRGLVKSVDNFGVMGDTPSHPELLDYLATQFVREGWDTKRLIRKLVLTHAYRLSSDASSEQLAADPENRLLWRHTPRRLDAEELRDTALAAAGDLERNPPEASPAQELKIVELRNNGPEAQRLGDLARASRHRSVYLAVLRGIVPRSLEVFDFAEQGMVTGSRDHTTVATQALYLLNDPFVRKQSLRLAEQLLRADGEGERVNRAYRLTLGRPATSAEMERALRFVSEYAAAAEPALVALATPTPAEGLPPDETSSSAPKKPPQNPDEADQTDEPAKEEVVQATSARAAAWASFCQALLGSAEFRYLK